MKKNKEIKVKGQVIRITSENNEDFICLTDMVKGFDGGSSLIENWLRNKNTVEFLGVWETINNVDFNSVGFDGIMQVVGLNRFKLSAKKWVQETNAIGLRAVAGKYGGTYAHKDIAFEFGSWLSPEFKLYLIKEFQRLKDEEYSQKNLEWNYRRFLTKVNYKIQTDSIKANLIPVSKLPDDKQWLIYAEEADILNFALFGRTAKEWREANPDLAKTSNIRDAATIEQLTVLANLESYNAILMRDGLDKRHRLLKLRESAIFQLKSLLEHRNTYFLDKNASATSIDPFTGSGSTIEDVSGVNKKRK